MMTNIRTNIFTPSGYAPPSKTRDKEAQAGDALPPKARGFQTIPSENVLLQLIDRALNAMKQGMHWDRGSILNIEV